MALMLMVSVWNTVLGQPQPHRPRIAMQVGFTNQPMGKSRQGSFPALLFSFRSPLNHRQRSNSPPQGFYARVDNLLN